jgi:hypothetical protein
MITKMENTKFKNTYISVIKNYGRLFILVLYLATHFQFQHGKRQKAIAHIANCS